MWFVRPTRIVSRGSFYSVTPLIASSIIKSPKLCLGVYTVSLNISFKGELRDSQVPAVDTMLENDIGILHAVTAFGKTVVCCDMIAKRGVSALILVDRTDLMNQWLKRLDEFLDIDEELPEYQTKTMIR